MKQAEITIKGEEMEKVYAGQTIDLNDEGYLNHFDQWTKEVGAEIAKEEGIDMTEAHWKIVDYIQEQFKAEVSLSIRKVGKSGVVDIKTFYQLFPKGPLKTSSRISGIPKPVSCI